MIGISGSLIWSKTLTELIFNPCGEFWGSPGNPVNQTLSSPPRLCPWDFFRSCNACSDANERVWCEKQREATAPIRSLVKLPRWFLSLWWNTCSLGSCACSEGPALGQSTMIMIIGLNISWENVHFISTTLTLWARAFRIPLKFWTLFSIFPKIMHLPKDFHVWMPHGQVIKRCDRLS